MLRAITLLLLGNVAFPVAAETVIAARTIRARAIVLADDIALSNAYLPGMFVSLDEVVGLETRVALYAGRPISPGDVGPPAIVERNQIVTLLYQSGALTIATEGRALGRGGVGDTIRAMNLGSRTTLSGQVAADGSLRILARD